MKLSTKGWKDAGLQQSRVAVAAGRASNKALGQVTQCHHLLCDDISSEQRETQEGHRFGMKKMFWSLCKTKAVIKLIFLNRGVTLRPLKNYYLVSTKTNVGKKGKKRYLPKDTYPFSL